MGLEQVFSDQDSEDEVDDDIADFEDRRVCIGYHFKLLFTLFSLFKDHSAIVFFFLNSIWYNFFFIDSSKVMRLCSPKMLTSVKVNSIT